MSDITIPAHPLLLDGWCGPARVLMGDGTTRWCAIHEGAASSGPSWNDIPSSGGLLDRLLLDLRRPEVRDRVSRVMWGVGGAVVQVQSGRVALFAGGYLRVSSRDRAMECLSSVAGLPESDRLPAALRMRWMRWLEVQS